MGATKSSTVLQALELDASIIESLPEAALSELIGFIEYDSRLVRRQDEQDEYRQPVAVGPVSGLLSPG